MIRFTTLKARNAFSYREMEFDFRSGLSSISGSNGSSKSSIFMTLCQGLFNRNPKGCKVGEVDNYISGKPYEIIVEFIKDGSTYRVENSRKSGTISVYRDGTDISMKRIPENLALIAEILGADYSTFADLVYQSKDTTLNLLETSTDKGRKEFTARILKFDELDAELSKMKEKEKAIAGKNGRLQLLQDTIQTLEMSLSKTVEVEDEKDIVELENALSRDNTELVRLQKEVTLTSSEVDKVAQAVADWQAEQEIRSELEELQADFDESVVYTPLEQLQLLVEEAQGEVSAIGVQLSVAESVKQQLEVKQRKEQELKNFEAKLEALAVPEMPLEDCRVQYEKITKASSARQSNLDIASKQLKEFQAAAAKGQCPTCGHEADVKGQVVTLQSEIAEHEAFIAKCATSLTKYKGWIAVWEARAPLTSSITNLKRQLEEYPTTSYEDACKTVKELSAAQAGINGRLKLLSQEQAAATTHARQKVEILSLQERLKFAGERPYTEDKEEELMYSLANLKEQVKEVQARIATLQTELEQRRNHNAKCRAAVALNQQVEKNNRETQVKIDQLRKEQEEKESTLELIKLWLGVLGSKGYRVARIKKFILSINQLMNKYAQMISSGRIKCSFFITDSGEIDFTITDEAKEMAYELWSGGEKARVKLVCLFAVLELLESMGSLSFNVLALDEIFDQLDTEGKEGLFNVLTYLKGHDKAVYTIAHSDLVLDLVYDYKVQATKLPDGTTTVGYC